MSSVIDIDKSGSLKQLNQKLGEIGRQLIDAASSVNNAVARQLGNEANNLRNIILTSMINTPRAPKFYKRPGGKRHHPSMPGSPPAMDSGELARSIAYDVGTVWLEIGVAGGAPYAEYLEDPDKLNRMFLKPAVDEREQYILNVTEDTIIKTFINELDQIK